MRPHLDGIDVDLVLLDVPADRCDFGDSFDRVELVSDVPILDAPQLGKIESPAGEVDDKLVGRLDPMDALADVAARLQAEPLANEVEQVVQFGLALGNERGRHVELVAGQGRQVEGSVPPGFHDELVDQMIAEHQPGHLLQHRLVVFRKQLEFPADVFDVVLEQHDAAGIGGPPAFKLVKVEPLQELAVDPQLQVGHDRSEVGVELRAGDPLGLLGLERERERPDPHLGARLEGDALRRRDFDVADKAAIQTMVREHELPALRPDHRMAARDERAL